MCKDAVYTVFVGEDKPLLNSVLISKMSRKDPVLAKVIMFTLEGWPERPKSAKNRAISGDSTEERDERPKSVKNKTVSGEASGHERGKRPKLVKTKTISGDSTEGGETDFKPYADKQTELSVDKGCLVWVGRVIINETRR